jgi:hypothetical protein
MSLLSKTAREFLAFRKRAAMSPPKDQPEPAASPEAAMAEAQQAAQMELERAKLDAQTMVQAEKTKIEAENEVRRMREEAKTAQQPQPGADSSQMAPPNPLGNPPPGLPAQGGMPQA